MSEFAKQKFIALLKQIILGSINIIEGSRQIVSLHVEQQVENDLDFLTIVGFASETDEFPLGDVRKRYNADYLKKLDNELEEYLAIAKPSIIKACENLLKKYPPEKIRIGVKGKILNGKEKDWFVLIQHDSENTGGYLILQAKEIDFSGEGYDNWVENKQELKEYFLETGWEVEWLD